MVLDELVGCIELLQERIRSHRDALRENETRTRMALIDPLLRALGWDVFDPEVVTPEYKAGGGWVDYALMVAATLQPQSCRGISAGPLSAGPDRPPRAPQTLPLWQGLESAPGGGQIPVGRFTGAQSG